jgi:pimeloyl-ACP methyl ester carboxylesterase
MQWVLLPGFDGTGMLYAPLLRALPPRVVPIVVRYPSNRICSGSELVEIVLSSLPESKPYVLIAESFSGPIALRASHLQAPTALVLCASFAVCPLPSFVITALRIIGSAMFRGPPPKWFVRRYLIGDAPNDVLSLFYNAIAAVSPQVLAHRFDVLLEFNGKYASGKLECPLLYLQATEDRLVSARSARSMERQYPGVRIERIESPHLVLQVQPQAAVHAILNFLAQLSLRERDIFENC